MSNNILVLNATGKVSRTVVNSLAAQGHQVIAASRHPRPSTGAVKHVSFSYEKPETFDAALDGVDRLFWVSPPLVLNGFEYTRPFLEKAFKRVRKAVLMTAAGVEADDNIPLRQAERLAEASGIDYVHLRPSWFSDNFHTFWVAAIKKDGVIPLPVGDGRTGFIDARDIADSAVAALTRADVKNAAYTLTGPEALTYAEAAAILSRAAGRDIRYIPIEDEAFVKGAAAAGIAEPYARMLVELFKVVRAGWAAQTTTAVADLTGRPPRTLEAYARDYWAPQA